MLADPCPRCGGQCYVEDVMTAEWQWVVLRCYQCGWEHELGTPRLRKAERKAVAK